MGWRGERALSAPRSVKVSVLRRVAPRAHACAASPIAHLCTPSVQGGGRGAPLAAPHSVRANIWHSVADRSAVVPLHTVAHCALWHTYTPWHACAQVSANLPRPIPIHFHAPPQPTSVPPQLTVCLYGGFPQLCAPHLVPTAPYSPSRCPLPTLPPHNSWPPSPIPLPPLPGGGSQSLSPHSLSLWADRGGGGRVGGGGEVGSTEHSSVAGGEQGGRCRGCGPHNPNS